MADEESKIFSLTEAERLRLQLEPVLIEAMDARRKLGELDELLGSLAERIQRSGGLMVSYEKIAAVRLDGIGRKNCSAPLSSVSIRPAASSRTSTLDCSISRRASTTRTCISAGDWAKIASASTIRQDEGFSGRKPIDPRDADYRNPIQ